MSRGSEQKSDMALQQDRSHRDGSRVFQGSEKNQDLGFDWEVCDGMIWVSGLWGEERHIFLAKPRWEVSFC